MSNANQSARQTIEQQRASQAWHAIEDVRAQSEALAERKQFHNNYGSQVRSLAAMIQANGLASTMAFLRAKGKEGTNDEKREFVALYQQLSQRIKLFLFDNRDLMEIIMNGSSDEYRRITAEAIAYANWLKRFVEARNWKSSEG